MRGAAPMEGDTGPLTITFTASTSRTASCSVAPPPPRPAVLIEYGTAVLPSFVGEWTSTAPGDTGLVVAAPPFGGEGSSSREFRREGEGEATGGSHSSTKLIGSIMQSPCPHAHKGGTNTVDDQARIRSDQARRTARARDW